MSTPLEVMKARAEELKAFAATLATPAKSAAAKVHWPAAVQMAPETTPTVAPPRPKQERAREVPAALRVQEFRGDPKLPSWKRDQRVIELDAQIRSAETAHKDLDRELRAAETELAISESRLYITRHPNVGESPPSAGELVQATQRCAAARTELERCQKDQLSTAMAVETLYAARLALEEELKPKVRDQLAALQRAKRPALIKAAETFFRLNEEMRAIDLQILSEFPGQEIRPGAGHFRMPVRGGLRFCAWGSGRHLTEPNFQQWLKWMDGD